MAGAPPKFPTEGTPKEIEEWLQRAMSIIPFECKLSKVREAYQNEFNCLANDEDMKEFIQVFGESLEQTLGCQLTLVDDSKLEDA